MSDEFSVKMGVHQGSAICIITAFVCNSDGCGNGGYKKRELHEILYEDDFVLMSETMEDLQKKFRLWKVTLESKGMKININKN